MESSEHNPAYISPSICINPLNPNVKIEILIYCPYTCTFSIEAVWRIC